MALPRPEGRGHDDYLGLSTDERVRETGIRAIRDFGVHSASSGLLQGGTGRRWSSRPSSATSSALSTSPSSRRVGRRGSARSPRSSAPPTTSSWTDVPINRVLAGEVLGELRFVDGHPASASVIADTEVEADVLDRRGRRAPARCGPRAVGLRAPRAGGHARGPPAEGRPCPQRAAGAGHRVTADGGAARRGQLTGSSSACTVSATRTGSAPQSRSCCGDAADVKDRDRVTVLGTGALIPGGAGTVGTAWPETGCATCFGGGRVFGPALFLFPLASAKCAAVPHLPALVAARIVRLSCPLTRRRRGRWHAL